MLTWIHWGALFLTLYTYLLFPALLSVLLKFCRNNDAAAPLKLTNPPSVAILCAMYNEEKVVREKIENFRKLNYGHPRLYIGSDGSSDRTNCILEALKNDDQIRVFIFPRRGKVHVLNDLIEAASEDILIFTDANSMFEPDAVKKLVEPFVDGQIGGTCGRLVLLDESGTSGEGFYWRYETFIKKVESRFNCVIGANGAIYAIRRELVALLPSNTINDDFTISMRALEKGFGIRYVQDAVATEKAQPDDAVEFRRHVRDAAGHYRAVAYLKIMLNPLHFKRFFFYVSHRVIRWFVPHFLLLLLIIPLFQLHDKWIKGFYLIQLTCYGIALLGYLSGTRRKFFYIPFYFVYINVALMIGFLRNLIGVQKVMWDSTTR